MDFVNHFDLQREKLTRSSLACLPCRVRHLKCDGAKPRCSRCSVADGQCRYTKSRRGGLDRQTLHERRKQLATEPKIQESPNNRSDASVKSSINFNATGSGSWDTDAPESPAIAPDEAASTVLHPSDISSDHLIDQYYKSFHNLHPFLLPRKELIRQCQNEEQWPALIPLIASMRLIGCLYSKQSWSDQLHSTCEQHANQSSSNGFMVQFHLLYAIALFWSGNRTDALSQHQRAAQIALDLGMHHKEFAQERENSDSIVAESWRRTWWSLFVIDAYYAGTLGTMNFTVLDIEATVDLPCEESDYEQGTIPPPRTLADFDCREFAAEEETYSSFTYLIGAVRSAALATSISLKGRVQDLSTEIIQAADSVIDGWLLLLPKASKPLMSKTGKIDELLFQAYLVVHVATISLHRPLSDLKFNATESISSCAREPATGISGPGSTNVHSVRVLRAVKEQIGLLALPARPFSHTPFVTCMISEGTLALLSACKFLLQGRELAIARDQIRMTIGCMSSLAATWTGTAKNLQEIKTIARHVFAIESKDNSTPSSSQVPSLSDGSDRSRLGSEIDAIGTDFFEDSMNTIGWSDLPDIDTSTWLTEFFTNQ